MSKDSSKLTAAYSHKKLYFPVRTLSCANDLNILRSIILERPLCLHAGAELDITSTLIDKLNSVIVRLYCMCNHPIF